MGRLKGDKRMERKEKLFCRYYARCGDPKQAAVKAGWLLGAERAGILLLEREEIRQEIKRAVQEHRELSGICQTAWERLAVGRISDAVRLLFHEGDAPPENLEEMELLNISEIKRPKGGGMEIKFFDRLKALEKLQETDADSRESEGAVFYAALEKGAAALKDCDENNEG